MQNIFPKKSLPTRSEHQRFIAIDVETTGLSAGNGGRVIEIGAVAVEGGEIVAELGTLIDSGAAISYWAYRVHGISQTMLSGQPPPHEVWPVLHEFIGHAPLIAHNAPFDRAFVLHELALLELTLNNSWHCTVRMARRLLPQLANHKLDTVYRALYGEVPADVNRHRALDDARLAAQIWLALAGRER